MLANKLGLVALVAAAYGGGMLATAVTNHSSGKAYADRGPDVEVFRAELAPYGHWVEVPTYGSVWVPSESGYQPYSRGHWVYTNQGFMWVSQEPFGWATAHYGHWVRDRSYGWVWVPGRDWTPANVQFYDTGDAIGWAPVDPDGHVYRESVRFVPYDRLLSPTPHRFYVRVGDFEARARVVTRLEPEILRRRGVTVQVQTVPVRRIRYSYSGEDRATYEERRAAAEERRAETLERRAGADEQRVLDQLRRQQDAEMQRLVADLNARDAEERADLVRSGATAQERARLAARQAARRRQEIAELQARQQRDMQDEVRRLRAGNPGRIR